jgi:hypothetical protein
MPDWWSAVEMGEHSRRTTISTGELWRTVKVSIGFLVTTKTKAQSCLRALRTIPSISWIGFCSVNCETLYRQVCAFPNHVQSIEFTTCGRQSSCRNITRMINGNRMPFCSILSLIAKGLNTYVNKVFVLYFFIN